MAKLIILSGIPCSGKSTFAVQEKWERERYLLPTVILSRDDIRKRLNNNKLIYDKGLEGDVTNEFWRLFSKHIKEEKSIIIDNTNCNPKYVREFIKNIPETYNWQILWFDIPLWKAYYRNIKRLAREDKWIPFKVIRKFYKEYKQFKTDYESGKIKF